MQDNKWDRVEELLFSFINYPLQKMIDITLKIQETPEAKRSNPELELKISGNYSALKKRVFEVLQESFFDYPVGKQIVPFSSSKSVFINKLSKKNPIQVIAALSHFTKNRIPLLFEYLTRCTPPRTHSNSGRESEDPC